MRAETDVVRAGNETRMVGVMERLVGMEPNAADPQVGTTRNNNVAAAPRSKSSTKVAVAGKTRNNNNESKVAATPRSKTTKVAAAGKPKPMTEEQTLQDRTFQPGDGVLILVGKYQGCFGDVDESFDPNDHSKSKIPIVLHSFAENGTLVHPGKKSYYPYQLASSED